MSSILTTPAAEGDLIGFLVYIAKDNEKAADRVYEAAQKTFELLAYSQHIGTLCHSKRIQLKGIRFFSNTKIPQLFHLLQRTARRH